MSVRKEDSTMKKKQITTPELMMQAKGIRRGDRVRIVGAWPHRATGQVSHIVAAGPKLLANVRFDKPHARKGYHCTYNWYEEKQLEKL
jgi:hypothetical protein